MASTASRLSAALLIAASLAVGCGQARAPVRSTRTGHSAPSPAGAGHSAPTAAQTGHSARTRTQTGQARPTPRPTPTGIHRLFAPNSVWNTPLAGGAAVDRSSHRLVSWLDQQVTQEFRRGPTPYIETVTDSTPIYEVPRDEHTVPVALENGSPWGASLARAFRSVPIPRGARPAAGSDAHMTIWQPSTDRLWEFWQMQHTSSGWRAAWGGAIDHVSHSPGYYTAHSWPGAKSYWGATATSLPVAAGTMLIPELEAGRINHALAIALPAARAGVYAWPAQRTDGTDPEPDSIPEGARLRLDPNLDIARLHLPPVIEAMALAAQRYGMIVRDKSGQAVTFYAQAPTSGGNPYSRIFGGIPAYDLLKRFPWTYLEVLRMRLHRGTGSP